MHGAVGAHRERRPARGRLAGATGDAPGRGEARAAVGRARDVQGSLVLGPGGVERAVGTDGEIEAAVVPVVFAEPPLAVACLAA